MMNLKIWNKEGFLTKGNWVVFLFLISLFILPSILTFLLDLKSNELRASISITVCLFSLFFLFKKNKFLKVSIIELSSVVFLFYLSIHFYLSSTTTIYNPIVWLYLSQIFLFVHFKNILNYLF